MIPDNIYAPRLMRVIEVTPETSDIQTCRLRFEGEAVAESFSFATGQFGLYSCFGEGESTFCIASSPTRTGYIECTFREVGRVTAGLARKNPGDLIGFRGPYGNSFPVEAMRGADVHIVGGGIGLAPLRSLIWYLLDNRDVYGELNIVYGARSVGDLVYKTELEEWADRDDLSLTLTVDPGGETPDWRGRVGFVPPVMDELQLSRDNAWLVTCGPPIMIRFVFESLRRAGWDPERVVTTLENRMKCGLGKCGRCNVGGSYVCVDGPVYTMAQLDELPNDL